MTCALMAPWHWSHGVRYPPNTAQLSWGALRGKRLVTVSQQVAVKDQCGSLLADNRKRFTAMMIGRASRQESHCSIPVSGRTGKQRVGLCAWSLGTCQEALHASVQARHTHCASERDTEQTWQVDCCCGELLQTVKPRVSLKAAAKPLRDTPAASCISRTCSCNDQSNTTTAAVGAHQQAAPHINTNNQSARSISCCQPQRACAHTTRRGRLTKSPKA